MTEPPDRELDVFSAARQLPPERRAAYLDQACAGDDTFRRRIESLLSVGDSPPTVATGPSGTMLLAAVATEKAGDRIGHYKLLQQIGEGGCGVVYMAEQEQPVRRRVALKVIKLGMDTKEVIARFEAERQALAMMDHPNIAKVLDAGATDKGRPYFVMELVRGIKITEYCDQNNLSTRQRLDLFIQICHAIQHAHQKGIIHRDIKPSNILVTMHDGVPVPKVIDFGIAKATHGKLTDQTLFTAFEQFIGTPAYMSPEQAEMSALDIDTRSDIYSLGVLLYELLTGQTPFDARELLQGGLDAIRRTIREQEPARPSTRLSTMLGADLTLIAKQRKVEAPGLINLVRGDLDWIVMKALEKDRTRRYETANGLAADIQRHLNNELVMARPPSNFYRLQKMARRNKLAFTAASAIVAALAVGVAVAVVGLVKEHKALLEADKERKQAEANEQKAEAEAAKSRQVAQFLKDMLNGVGPSVALGRDTTLLREILDNTAKRVGTDMVKQPDVEAELRYTLGEVYWELGDLEDAEAMHRSALNIRLREFGTNNAQVAESMRRLGHVLWRRGRLEDAEKMAVEGVAMQRKLFGSTNLEVAGSLQDLAAIFFTRYQLNPAEKALRESLAIKESLLGHNNLEIADTMRDLAAVLVHRGKEAAEADALDHESLAIRRKLLGADNPLVIIETLASQATELERKDKLSEAETMLNEILAEQRKLYGQQHPSMAQTLNRLADDLRKDGKLKESETARYEALAMQRKCLGNENAEVAFTLSNLGLLLREENKLSEAEIVDREALAIRKQVFGDNSIYVKHGLTTLVGVLKKEDKLEEVKSLLLETANGTNAAAANAQNIIGDMYQHGQGVPKDMAEAEKWFRKAAENGDAGAQNNLGWIYQEGLGVKKDYAEAFKWFRKGAEQGNAQTEEKLGRMYREGWGVQKDYTEAVKWYRKAVDQDNSTAQKALGEMYENGWGVAKDYAEALKLFRLSADQGDSGGFHGLARMYANGWGLEKDYARAVTLYLAAGKSVNVGSLNDFAWRLATSATAEMRSGTNAVRLAEKVVAEHRVPMYLDTLAAAYAEAQQFEKAVATQQEAIDLLQGDQEKKEYGTRFTARLQLYQAKIPYHEGDPATIQAMRKLADDEARRLEPVLDIINFDNIPWPDAVNALARKGGIKIEIDPKLLNTNAPDGHAVPITQPLITEKWQKMTAKQGLTNLLDKHGWRLVVNSGDSVGRITAKTPSPQEAMVAEVIDLHNNPANLEKRLASKRLATMLTLATWQTWFGYDTDYEATCLHMLQQPEGTNASRLEQAAKAYCLRPSTNAALLTKALTLAQHAVEIGKKSPALPWYQLALGLAEYRNGQYADAERALTNAEHSPENVVLRTARLVRAMSLFRQDRPDEARKLFSQAEAQMPPLPADERKPLINGNPVNHDDLICWLAYKEAKSILNEPAAKP